MFMDRDDSTARYISHRNCNYLRTGPVWGGAFAWFLLGERWGVSGLFGAALVLGGSLMVQIIGVSSPTSTEKRDGSRNKQDITLLSDKHNGLSAAPILVRKDVSDLLK